MSDLEAHFAAILANPHDNTVRLSYADHIEETGPDWVKCQRCGGSGHETQGRSIQLQLHGGCPACSGRGDIDRNAHAGERAELIRLQCGQWVEVPCPMCTPYLNEHHHLFNNRPGYHPERDPASGRHEGGWTNCKTCNSGGPDQTRPGIVCDRSREYALIELGRGLGWWDVGLDNPHRSGGTFPPPDRTNEIFWRVGQEHQFGSGFPPTFIGTVARGFVDSITLTTALFTQHAAAIFARQPILTCTLSDRGPQERRGIVLGRRSALDAEITYDWYRRNDARIDNLPAYVPNDIFDRMFADHYGIKPSVNVLMFDTRADARQALSRAACEVGRSAAKRAPALTGAWANAALGAHRRRSGR